MRVFSGIQPSGELHLGNYFGMMSRMITRQNENELLAFIADYHALTSLSDGKALRENIVNAAINFLSLGLDPAKATFWVQSDVKEVLELYWTLSNFTPMGLLERAHSYKDKVAKGIHANHGLFSYPVLMAADILLFRADVVPVGKDQIQHLEMTRDIAIKFNNEYGDILTIPQTAIEEDVATVPGIDGAKMSKSYGNTIDIFCDYKTLKKKCGQIVTESVPLEAPKEWETCNVYAITKLFNTPEENATLQERYKSGGFGHGHFKIELADKIWAHFEQARVQRDYYLNHKDEVFTILDEGAKKARFIASEVMEKVRSATGLNYRSIE